MSLVCSAPPTCTTETKQPIQAQLPRSPSARFQAFMPNSVAHKVKCHTPKISLSYDQANKRITKFIANGVMPGQKKISKDDDSLRTHLATLTFELFREIALDKIRQYKTSGTRECALITKASVKKVLDNNKEAIDALDGINELMPSPITRKNLTDALFPPKSTSPITPFSKIPCCSSNDNIIIVPTTTII